ncbi:hypothetical protein [Polaribacter litorisediminis]|uniref:hypothetical protein n=1 Tax=Polaribacter litorisediminis TaxID=1908341 RepID=UPI001CBEDB07|nr:hypothetical protein [Polaribacter litorisediminis]
MTPNINTRKEFELRLKKEFEARGIEAVISLEVFEPSFTGEKVNALELQTIENILAANYFDAILFTKLIGSETKLAYSNTFKNSKYLNLKFKEDYYEHQEIFYNHKYYDKYKVYHAETSLFCICPTKDRELVWKGYIDISSPTSAEKSLKDYVKVLISALEEQLLLPKTL